MRKALMLCLVAALSLVGCGREAPVESAEPAKPEAPAVPASNAEIEAKLAAADRVDGAQDQVVSQCPGCGLAMEGSEDFVVEVADYSLHFCSDSCKDNFTEDPEGSLMALAVPQEEQEPGEPEEAPQQ